MMPATRSTSCIGSAYWRRNSCTRRRLLSPGRRRSGRTFARRASASAGRKARLDRHGLTRERIVDAQRVPRRGGARRGGVGLDWVMDGPPPRAPATGSRAPRPPGRSMSPSRSLLRLLPLLRLPPAAFAASSSSIGSAAAPGGACPSSSVLATWSASRASRLTRGKRGSISIRALASTPAAATRANGLSSAGMTYHGRPVGARLRQDVAERLLVVVPVRALLGVVGAELPVLLRLVDPGQEPTPLLLLAQVEEQLDDA